MPTMLVRPRARRRLLERLEIHYLANPDPQLRFALLTDFADAPAETMPEDEAYVQDALERRQGPERALRAGRAGPVLPVPPPAALEPGPGLLDGLGAEARQALRVQPPAPRRPPTRATPVVSGDPAALPRIRFVITLDADTRAAARHRPAAGRRRSPTR